MLWQERLLDGLSVVAVLLYFAVAISQTRRQVSPEARPARRGFILWWAGVGTLGLAGLILARVVDPATLSIGTFRFIIYPLLGLIFTAVGGLLMYLLYLYTGRPTSRFWVAAFYLGLFLFSIWFIESQQPYMGIDPETGEPGIQYADEAHPVLSLVFSMLLLVPPLAAAIAYFLLFFRTRDRTARYRIAMVSGGLVLWLGFSAVNSFAGALAEGGGEAGFTEQIVSQSLGVLSAVLVLLAFHPPRWLQGALGVAPVQSDDRPAGGSPPDIDRGEDPFKPPEKRLADELFPPSRIRTEVQHRLRAPGPASTRPAPSRPARTSD